MPEGQERNALSDVAVGGVRSDGGVPGQAGHAGGGAHLIAAEPWSTERAIADMVASACVYEGRDSAGRSIRIYGEQLIAAGLGGRELQSVRIAVPGLDLTGTTSSEVRVDLGAQAVSCDVRPGPAGSVRVLVPVVDAPTKVNLHIAIGTHTASCAFVLAPARRWTVHLVHHSHFDLGYTDLQTDVYAQQRSYIDSCIDLFRQTASWPEEARFRWSEEALFAFEDWRANRPPEMVDELMEYVREGRFELTAMPFNLHTDTCSTDELAAMTARARKVQQEYGITMPVAMQTDVPGQVVGLVDALAGVGVTYLAVAHNWAGRTVPPLVGGLDAPRLFRWRSPAGNELMVWQCDTPSGFAYLEGPLLGFHDSVQAVEEYLPLYLQAVATSPYPFRRGLPGWNLGWDVDASSRPAYPWDVLHIRTQGYFGDNAPARLCAARIVRAWNEEWLYPRLRVSVNRDFFDDVEERIGDQLPVFSGDWGDWWVEGVGSAAYPQKVVRAAQALQEQAQTVDALTAAHGLGSTALTETRAAHAYQEISLFNEHTWGAGNSWLDVDYGLDSGTWQWHRKVAHAFEGHEQAVKNHESATWFLGRHLGTGVGALTSVYVINPEPFPRDGVCDVLVRESVVPFDTPVRFVDGRTGAVLPSAARSRVNPTHNESGRRYELRVPMVPACGWVRVDVVACEEEQTAEPANALDDPSVSIADLSLLENEALAVRVDLARACIVSVLDKRSGRELVNDRSVLGMNQYVYDAYSTAFGFNHNANKQTSSDGLDFLGARTAGSGARIVAKERDDIESRLVYEFAPEGARRVTVTLRLRHHDDVLLIENRIAKPSTTAKESAYIAFPFSAEDPVVRYEVSGSVAGDGIESIPGAPRHLKAVRDWVSIDSDAGPVVWATPDAPLVERGTIALPYAPFPASTSPTEPATLYSWVHNNVWDTNFPVQQGFETTFRYAIGIGSQGTDAASAAVRVAAHLRPTAVVQGGQGSATVAEWSAVSLDDDRVRLVTMIADDEAVLLRCQSYVDHPVTVTATVGFAIRGAWRTTYLGEPVEQVNVDGERVCFEVAPLGVAGLRLIPA